jgi:hypothetical protein
MGRRGRRSESRFITADLIARIDAALEADEFRVDFIRDACKRELERRERTAAKKPRKERR